MKYWDGTYKIKRICHSTGLEEQKAHIEATMKRLNYKISCYEKAVKTGKLVWDKCEEK